MVQEAQSFEKDLYVLSCLGFSCNAPSQRLGDFASSHIAGLQQNQFPILMKNQISCYISDAVAEYLIKPQAGLFDTHYME